MTEKITVARPYAVAVWRHASATNKVASWAQMLTFMAQVASDKSMAAIIADPRVGAQRLTQLILDICADRINDAAANFVRLLVTNGKLSLMPEISALFDEMKSAADGVIDATMLTAYPVNAEFEKTIAKVLQKKLSRRVNFVTEEDKSLLGGVIVHVGDIVIDLSVRGRMTSLATALRQ